MTEFANDSLFLWLSTKLLSLPSTSSNCIVKFATHYSYYKDELVSNPTWTFFHTANYFLYSLSNLLAISFLDCDRSIYTILLSLATKNKELLRIGLYLFYLL